jgi:hypothetical protein
MAVWLAFSLSEPAILHSCPVHDAGVSGHSMHGGMASMHQPANHSRSNGHACTCIGSCCSVAPVGLAAESISIAFAATTTVRDTGLPDYEYLPVAAAHVLPFSNGPPATV